MKERKLSRRQALAQTGLLLGGATAVGLASTAISTTVAAAEPGASPFRFCLNTATIRGQKVGIVKEIEIASQAGYDAIEPWVDSIDEYVKNGGALADLRKKIADSGLTVEGAIGF